MVNFVTAAVAVMAVIAVFCQGGIGVYLKSRCLRICELWNSLPEHLKGIPENTRRMFSVHSGLKRNFITRGCDCETFISHNFHRNRRSILRSTKPTLQSNTNKSTSEITSTTSNPRKKPDESAMKCRDPPDRNVNRTWKAHNISEITPKKISVDFKKNGSDWYANVTWLPPPDERHYGFLVIWSISGSLDIPCKEVLNNKMHIILDKSSGWKQSEVLFIAVFSLPGYIDIPMEDRNYKFSSYEPEILKGGIRITLEPPRADHSLKYGSLLAGVLAGLLLIVVLLVFVLYRRKTCGSHGSQGLYIIPMQENNNAEGFVKINNTTKPQNNDVYFASYLPENEKFSNEVATIAYKLGTMGYKVTFDKVDSVHMNEIGFNMWVDKQILEAKKYIVFCSPGYVRLWQSLASSNGVDNKFNNVNEQDLVRVRYEIKRISDVYSENCSTSRIVCIKMDPKMTTRKLPPWMNHNTLLWPEQKEDVIRRLNDQAAMVMHV